MTPPGGRQPSCRPSENDRSLHERVKVWAASHARYRVRAEGVHRVYARIAFPQARQLTCRTREIDNSLDECRAAHARPQPSCNR